MSNSKYRGCGVGVAERVSILVVGMLMCNCWLGSELFGMKKEGSGGEEFEEWCRAADRYQKPADASSCTYSNDEIEVLNKCIRDCSSDFPGLMEGCSYGNFTDVCLQRMLSEHVKNFEKSTNYEEFMDKAKSNRSDWLGNFWTWKNECKKDWEGYWKRTDWKLDPNVVKGKALFYVLGGKLPSCLENYWLSAGSDLYGVFNKVEDCLDLWAFAFQKLFEDWCKEDTQQITSMGQKRLSDPMNNARQRDTQSRLIGECLVDNGSVGFNEILSQSNEEVKTDTGNRGYNDFLEKIARSQQFIEKFSSIKSATDFESKHKFLIEIKRLVLATRTCYYPFIHQNEAQEFLLEKAQGRDYRFNEEMNAFFSHFEIGLRGSLYRAFEDWGKTPKLKIVLLYGNPGSGKTASLSWLFARQRNPSVAVVRANPGDSFVGSRDAPGILDELLLQNSFWRCINMNGELSSEISSVRKLINNLRFKGRLA